MATPQSPTATDRDVPPVGSTRTRLLDAAYELLVQDGYHATTVQGVARRAGLTTGAIYANFANKQELMALAVLARWTGLQQQLLAGGAAGPPFAGLTTDGPEAGGPAGNDDATANGETGDGESPVVAGWPDTALVAQLAQLLTAPPAPEHRLLTEVTGAVLRDGGTVSPLLSGVQMVEGLIRSSIETAKDEGTIDEKLSTDAIVAVVLNLYLGAITSKAWGLEQPRLDEVREVLIALNRGLAARD
ncbi:MAG TPA: TetR/AcrR family transcriptional regulator [Acidimicrobiales bacterium]